MPVIGVRELREHTADVLRQVREQKAEYVITYQGKPVAFLAPVDEQAVESAMVQAGRSTVEDGWDAYMRLVEELRSTWPADLSTQDLLDEIRG
ncbi:MAG TPA: type II toxin-antitoxin system prevent-host-death family antitoxin [Anaerolineae bacterium]|nr:type II toxin-antitoxin system prevent-host-death family antitoxin [Anaerolineae bacterium]